MPDYSVHPIFPPFSQAVITLPERVEAYVVDTCGRSIPVEGFAGPDFGIMNM